MTTSEGSQLLQMFGGFLKHFSAEKPQETASSEKVNPLKASTQLLDGAVAELQKKIEMVRQERRHSLGGGDRAVSMTAEDIRKSVEEIHARIRSDILSLHSTLGTHLSEAGLDSARALLLELDEVVSGKRGSGFDARIRASVIKEVLGRCARAAWSSLHSLMERAKVVWPEPTGLPPWAKAEDVAAANERAVSEIAETFAAASPARIADRMFGIVSAWKANYPDPESSQWRQLVLQGVGYGIFAQIVLEATVKLRHESDALMAEAMQMISSEALSVRKALERDAASTQDVDKVLAQVSALCEEVIPELAWKAVEKNVEDAARRIVG